jgi:D-hydroxyproline dehydrogenase subunit beta
VSRPDAIVVGAGVVGGACAEALARAGARVLVLDAGYAGGGATAAAMGHVVVMDDSEAQLALTALSRALWEERADELPADCEDDPCGTLWVASEPEEMELVLAKARSYRDRGVAVDVLDGMDLRQAEPHLRPGLLGALHVPGDRVVYPPAAARFFLAEALRHGAELREGVAVTGMRARAVECPGGTIEADVVVNAAGGRAAELVPGLPIEPRKGHLVITERAPGFLRHEAVELGYLKSAHTLGRESVAFNVQPRKTGQVLVGSSREFVGADARINGPLRGRMLARAFTFMPRLAELRALRTWVGFRPATPDKLPLIGRWEKGLYVAAGHEGLGVTMATGTARLIADLVTGRNPPIDPHPYNPRRATRFGDAAADREQAHA